MNEDEATFHDALTAIQESLARCTPAAPPSVHFYVPLTFNDLLACESALITALGITTLDPSAYADAYARATQRLYESTEENTP